MAGILAGAQALGVARAAQAQAVDGSWQLGLATNFWSHTRTTTTVHYLWGRYGRNDEAAHAAGYTFGLSIGASGWIGP